LRSPALRRHLEDTVIEQMDFEEFLGKYEPEEDDFLFLDPPYDSEFNTYTQNTFDMRDQERLADYLRHRCRSKFLLVIKYTPAIYALYNHPELFIRSFDKRYMVSFQDRNNREAEHLVITNYKID
jgi:DNA adenine methylase